MSGGNSSLPFPTLVPNRIVWDLYNQLRRQSDCLGVDAGILNDWSMAAARGVSTDWVLTLPGQYNMIDYFVWFSEAVRVPLTVVRATVEDGDAWYRCVTSVTSRLSLELTIYDREEGEEEVEDPDLIVSPAPTVPGV